jgi:polyhydroxyalkanoate synthesis repressor PhaR
LFQFEISSHYVTVLKKRHSLEKTDNHSGGYEKMSTPSNEDKEDIIIIKRYANRRLYDTRSSRYVNLEILAEMVMAGYRLQVIDLKTNKDITKMILTQIILDKEKDEKDEKNGLPLDLLFDLVKRGSSSYMGVMEDIVSLGPKVYDKTIGKVQSTLSPKPEKKDPTSTADEINELKKRLAEVEAKLKAAENDKTKE